MEGKFELFDELPPEIQGEIAQSLSTPDLLNFTMISKNYSTLFKPMVDVRKLLPHVVGGEHNAVCAMLKKDMDLIFKGGKVTDCSVRTFERISAFEYALWALDKHMWTSMLNCIPKNEQGKEVLAKLFSQYKKVSTEGVTYRLNGEIITENHFDFENTIIKELQTQVNSTNVRAKNWDAIDKQWREHVGNAQKLFPMHVVYEYCSNEPFYPMPQFASQPKSLKQFYNWITEKDENWFSLDSKLGVDFAICKDTGVMPRSMSGGGYGRVAVVACSGDLDALKALCKVRTMDFINLESQLEMLITVDNPSFSNMTDLAACR